MTSSYADQQDIAGNLLYYPDTEPGIARRRCGRGFTYIAPDGTRIDCGAERKRLQQLAVPPAYEDVWICPLKQGHLQATGRDARKRKQYRYHPDWSQHRAARKFDRLSDFAEALPRMRRWIAAHLRGEVGAFETAIAAILALIDRASLRVGHPEYSAENATFGATTLRNDHIEFEGSLICLNYEAKGGRAVSKRVTGSRLQRVLQQSQDLPGAELVTWVDRRGQSRVVRSEQLQQVLADLCGDNITPKTLRTWNGSHEAFTTALEAETLTISAMAEAASRRLHNTPTIAQNSYIHHAIIDLASREPTARRKLFQNLKPVPHEMLRYGEPELIAFLNKI